VLLGKRATVPIRWRVAHHDRPRRHIAPDDASGADLSSPIVTPSRTIAPAPT
jgi:hypothetical protein